LSSIGEALAELGPRRKVEAEVQHLVV